MYLDLLDVIDVWVWLIGTCSLSICLKANNLTDVGFAVGTAITKCERTYMGTSFGFLLFHLMWCLIGVHTAVGMLRKLRAF